jgi:hypothetical protein
MTQDNQPALRAAIRAAKLALFVIKKQGVMPNGSWEKGFAADLAIAEAGLAGLAEYKAENAKNGWAGRGFSFDPGFLNLDRDGAATIGFAESDMQYERDDETGRDYVYCNVPVSEILALRDYLNEAFPVDQEQAKT